MTNRGPDDAVADMGILLMDNTTALGSGTAKTANESPASLRDLQVIIPREEGEFQTSDGNGSGFDGERGLDEGRALLTRSTSLRSRSG